MKPRAMRRAWREDIRYVPLTRAQLVELITGAAHAIATLDREEDRT